MDWKDIGKLIAPIAPIAGSILGGLIPFPGGSIIGEKFGTLIASAFGVEPTPKSVSDAITNAGRDEAVAKIGAATDQARAQITGFVDYERNVLDAMVKNLGDVNTTMRAEAAERSKLLLAGIKDHWFFTGWRPFFGWSFGIVYLAFGLMLVIVTGKTAWYAPDPLTVLSNAWPIFLAYFGPGGVVVGVLIPSRSAEKVAAIKADAAVPAPPARPVMMRPTLPPQPAQPAQPPPPLAQTPLPPRAPHRIPDPPGSRP